MHALYLRRKRRITVPTEPGATSPEVIAALQKNIESLGYVLAPAVCERLEKLPLARVEAFYKHLVAGLREMVGAHRSFRPMYPNFPAEVMEMAEARLYLNAILHYWTNRLLPRDKRERSPLAEGTNLKLIDLGSREDFEQIFSRLVSAKTSLSTQDKTDVSWFVAQYRDDIVRLLPKTVPSRENLAVVGAALLKHTTVGATYLAPRISTPTDVLRLAVALSDGDVSLAEPTKFAKFTRVTRALLLSWVERSSNPTEDMLRWKDRWIRLGERLHPGDYVKRFPRTWAAFDVIRNSRPFETFNAAVERHLAAGDAPAAIALLESRPGELVRRLDHLVRKAKQPHDVVAALGPMAAKVATPVLLQAMEHFRQRASPPELRTFFPKGDVAKVQAIPNKLPPLPAGMGEALASVCESTLLERFSRLAPLGNCYLDPQLRDFLVPFSQRSAAKALRTLVRGSSLPLRPCKVLRLFIWWRNGSSRTDIDLSAAFYDTALRYVDVVAYYNLKNYGGCHSGDIVDAPEGAAEFIDLDVERIKALGVRYVVMSINSFTRQPYCDLPECFAGWMARQEPNSGEIFEARTVQDKVDVASDTQVCLPAVFDLAENKVLWTDLALRGSPFWNNVKNNLSGVSLMLRAMLGLRKPTLHTLFDLHIRARGTAVATKEQAQTVFSVDVGLTPFDLDRIVTEFL